MQPHEQVHMIGDAVEFKQFSLFPFENASNVFLQTRLDRRRNEWSPFLRAEYEMIEQVAVGTRHSRSG
jgi:hypothetical protein